MSEEAIYHDDDAAWETSEEAAAPTALAVVDAPHAPAVLTVRTFSRTQLDLIKRTVASGTSDDEFALFIEVAKRSGLDPFQRQIYAVMRWDGATKRNKMTIQTGIDGFASIADRTGTLAGVDRPEFAYSASGAPESAVARVWKIVSGQRVPFEAEAYWDEYVQTDKDGSPTRMWKRMPRTMLYKCALAKAYRLGFPSQISGLYTADEMEQADNDPAPTPAPQPAQPATQRTEKPATSPTRQQTPATRQTPPAPVQRVPEAPSAPADERVSKALQNQSVLGLLTDLGITAQAERRAKVGALLQRLDAAGTPVTARAIMDALDAELTARRVSGHDLAGAFNGAQPN